MDIQDGIVGEPGKNISISLREIADLLAGAPGYKLAAGLAPGLDFAVNFQTSALTYGIGAHAVLLSERQHQWEISESALSYRRKAINLAIAEVGIYGGVVHGIGNALFEWMGYDGNAQPLTMTLAEYLLRTAAQIPSIDVQRNNTPAQKIR